jgi:Tol biopolymer transport system component
MTHADDSASVFSTNVDADQAQQADSVSVDLSVSDTESAGSSPANTTATTDRQPFTLLVDQAGGRVDWNGPLLAYSSILHLADGGTLSSEIWTMPAVSNMAGTCLTGSLTGIPHVSNDQPAWHPSGKYLLFQSADPTLAIPSGMSPSRQKEMLQGGFGYNNNLWIMSPAGSVLSQLVQVAAGGATLHPHFSPDGTKVFWSSSIQGAGWVLKLADFIEPTLSLANIRTITPFGTGPGKQTYEAHDVSADNSVLLFSYSADLPLDLDIWSYSLQTGVSTNLSNAPGVWDEHAHWAPDGATIAWVSSRGFSFTPADNWQTTLRTEVWLMDRDGSNKRQVTFYNTPGSPGYVAGHVICADLAWSPDGTSLVVCRSAAGDLQVVRIDL